MDYEGERDFNKAKENWNLPNVSLGSSDVSGMSRSNPLLYSTDGYANVLVGVSAFGGGDGSDLEIAIKNFDLGPTQFVTLIFGTH